MRLVFSSLLLMLCSATLQAAPEAVESANSICCPNVSKTIIPLRRLESYFWTSSSCFMRRVVFETTAKKQFCVEPDLKWVKRAINHIDNTK